MIIAGIDCSTTICGWSFIDKDTKELIDYGYLIFDKKLSVSQRVFEFRNKVLPTLEIADEIVLEERLKSFSFGKTSTDTLMNLSHINGAVDYILRDYFGFDNVDLVEPRTARKRALGMGILPKPKALELGFIDKNGKVDTKGWIVSEVVKRYPQIQMEYKKNSTNLKDHMFDICDSVVLALSKK
jgi:Holliday junction resolvasome RuvABC endonuclease subunit